MRTAAKQCQPVGRWITVAMATVLLVACSKIPDEETLRQLVETQALDEGLSELLRVENFHKINGFEKSDKIYIADVEYDLVFQKSFSDVVKAIGEDPTGPQYGAFGAKFILLAVQSNFGRFEAGDSIHKVDKITLYNTEQGWRIAE